MKLNKTIQKQKKDIEALKEIERLGVKPSKLNDFNFNSVAVIKPWGFEYLASETDDKNICAWVLHFKNNGTGTSMHCHKNKKTLLTVISGKMWFKTLYEDFIANTDDYIYIDKATFHSMGALVDGTVMSEIESPSFKPDAIRYKDLWGRERQEYESKCELKSIDNLNCPYLDDELLNLKIKELVDFAEECFLKSFSE